MKKFLSKRGSSRSLASQLPSEDNLSVNGKSPVVLRRPQNINLDVSPLGKSAVHFKQNGSVASLPSMSKSNPPSPVTFTPPLQRRLKKTRSHDHSLRPALTSFSSGASLHSTILTQSDSMTSLSRDSLNSSMTSLSLTENNSPLSSSLNLSTTTAEPKDSNRDIFTSEAPTTSSGKPSSEKKKKGLFRIPFIGRNKGSHNANRRNSADLLSNDLKIVPERRTTRSQSLTPENLSDILSRIREENEELQLAVRSRDEELKLLNASIDIANRTWETKVQALQKDVVHERKMNEKLTKMITQDFTQPSSQVRVPFTDKNPKSPTRDGPKLSKAAGPATSPSTNKKRGVWEPTSKKFMVAKSYEKTPEVRQKLENALWESKCLSQLSPDVITKIVDVMKVKKINKGERLMVESTHGAHFYVLAEGDCRIFKKENELEQGSNLIVGERVAHWSVFGEADIFYHTKRVSSCKSVQPGVVWFISREEYSGVVRQQDIGKRKKEIYHFLRKIKCFQNVEPKRFHELVKHSKIEHFSPGGYIVRQGDLINNVYAIKEGEVRVTKHVDGTESLQETLRFGCLIGEVKDTSHHKKNFVASDSQVVQCIVIPIDKFDAVRHFMTSSSDNVTNENVEMGMKQHLTTPDGGSEKSGSSGYGSDKMTRPRDSWKKYGERHEVEYRRIREKLRGKNRDSFNYISTVGNGAFGTVDLVATNTGDYHVFAIKKLSRKEMLESEQQQQVKSERTLQLHMSHHCPFIASLYRTFDDTKFVYLVMEFCGGGELFSLLKVLKCFDTTSARFYTACMIEALAYLHSNQVVFRDLKPENVVIDRNGYCKLTDFGFAKHLGGARSIPRTYTFCGTPEYMAPETILYKAQTVTVDLWALGIFVFELLTGKAPFRNKNRKDLSDLILRGIQTNLEEAKTKVSLSEAAFNIIDELCQIRPEERLGSGRNGFDDVRSHPWFQGFDWMALQMRTMSAPWTPKLKTAHDTHYFDTDSKETGKEFENFDGTSF